MIDRLDPLETSRQIEESYKRFLKTLLSPRMSKLAEAFDAESRCQQHAHQGPMLELTPPYETAATPGTGRAGRAHPDFRSWHPRGPAAVRPPGDRDPQVPRGPNLVVSTGTGSGRPRASSFRS